MNYRQWKKNYKKRHGYNPPLEADLADVIKRTLTERTIAGFYRGLSNGFRAAADAAQSIAERIERDNK